MLPSVMGERSRMDKGIMEAAEGKALRSGAAILARIYDARQQRAIAEAAPHSQAWCATVFQEATPVAVTLHWNTSAIVPCAGKVGITIPFELASAPIPMGAAGQMAPFDAVQVATPPGGLLQSNPLGGNASRSTAPSAREGPLFKTLTVNLTSLPVRTCGTSAVLVTDRSAMGVLVKMQFNASAALAVKVNVLPVPWGASPPAVLLVQA